jgi:putative protease
MFRIPELLAPAGGMEQLKAAVENGADAVYMGGKLFNARINADNFSDAEMKEAIDYAI